MRCTWLLTLILVLPGLGFTATPPDRLNYQGVLRNSSGVPLDGSYAMTFRFYSAASIGSEYLVDTHVSVTVSGGLFSVALGTGTVTDGSGAGTYTTLSDVFKDSSSVWLEIQVAAETLSPRIQIHSAPYALNADHLDGRDSSEYSLSTHNHFGQNWLDTTAGPGFRVSNDSTSGGSSGIYGEESGSSGNTYGVYGVAASPEGYAVFGNATNAAGNTIGVRGEVSSPNGWGLFTSTNAFVGGKLDFGVGMNDDLTASDVTTLTGGGNADSLHTHTVSPSSHNHLGAYWSGDISSASGFRIENTSDGIGSTGIIGEASGANVNTFGVHGISTNGVGIRADGRTAFEGYLECCRIRRECSAEFQ